MNFGGKFGITTFGSSTSAGTTTVMVELRVNTEFGFATGSK